MLQRGFADWWATTAGPRWVRLRRAATDHRRFWDAMDRLGEVQLREIETRLGRAMVAEFELDLCGLALDMTNFATFIDTGNERAPIAQRGKAKQKRTDLRLVGLALVITRDGGVPMISHAYPGDRPDVTQFSTVIDELVARYRDLVAGVESLTVVYDAGQNSGDNHAVVEAPGIGFVGSLPPSDHPDLLDIPDRAFRPADPDRYPGLTYVDTTVTALGVTRRAVITHSANLHAKQSRGLDQTLAKARRRLAELAARLARGHTRRDRAKVEAEIAAICKPRWVSDIITVTLTGEAPAELPAVLAQRRPRPRPTRGPPVRQADPIHQPRLASARRGGRLPLPIRRRIRLPPTQGPACGLVQPDAPLDRQQDPRAPASTACSPWPSLT